VSETAERHYTRGFFEQIRSGSRRSAEVVVPLISQFLRVSSMVDVGCGEGNWLAVFREHGVKETIGMDGEYVSRDALQIPQECFRAIDLTKAFDLGRVFDLAISLEVAEHLPAACAPGFVASLCSLSEAVLFSAAVPFQGGNQHLNEQWPDYWAGMFRKHGYFPVDCIRKRVWQNEAVEWWYAQNMLLFVSEEALRSNQVLKEEFEKTSGEQLRLIHPRNYLEVVMPGVRGALRLLVDSVARAVRKRIAAAGAGKRLSKGTGSLDSVGIDAAARKSFRRNDGR